MSPTDPPTNPLLSWFAPELLRNYWEKHSNVVIILWLAFAYFVTSRVLEYINASKVVGKIPVLLCAFEPFSIPGALLPSTWWNPGIEFHYIRRLHFYQSFRSETVAIIPILVGKVKLWTSDLEVVRQVVAGGPHSHWVKPFEFSQSVLFFGMNLIGADGGELWRRHRRIMGPAFNQNTYELVWKETMRVYHDMIASEGWTSKDTLSIPEIQQYTLKVALFVISACGFGIPLSWNEPPLGEQRDMSIQESLRIISDSNLIKTILPKWLFSLPVKKFQRIETAYRTLNEFMHSQVETRKAEIRQEIEMGEDGEGGRSDVFSRLVRANEVSTEKLPLDNQELIGNVYAVLLAGHETTGHTLAATLGYLALYQHEQDIVYDQISSVLGERDPIIEDYGSLYKVLCAFYEALRLIPPASMMIRGTTQDTVLTLQNSTADEPHRQQPLPKGTTVVVDLVGMQYNPKYFPEPNEYKPSRWYAQETSEGTDAFTAFSLGPRTCIGRKFATIEAVCFLALLLRDFHVEVVLRNGETTEQWRSRVMNARIHLTLNVESVPLKLTRRRKL
ncbi:cytochrome P450 [Rickenella mellea]|uniref:Cytochrome P450 n=1 Tax=Rickenella mellea TaxID=50990 RepID=A0A4Y7Q688_9AGAM|nr:cytochrome P450 [Rickenella mellea]